MDATRHITPGRLERLTDELLAERLGAVERSSLPAALVDELDYALRPPRHERRVPSYGSFVLPTEPVESWSRGTGLDVTVSPPITRADDEVRRYSDGLTSWTIRTSGGINALAMFDRPAGSERDMVVLAAATGAMVVQRHPNGVVRIVGSFGVARWDGIGWQVEPPVESWLDGASADGADTTVLESLGRFAAHDLGAHGIGAMLVLGATDASAAAFERRLPTPPPFAITDPSMLGPLRHVLTQIDGAVLFDSAGRVIELGVRIVPTADAEDGVDAIGGTRHTTARRYSYDDPAATVIVVSEAGPVTVFRAGEIVGRSAR